MQAQAQAVCHMGFAPGGWSYENGFVTKMDMEGRPGLFASDASESVFSRSQFEKDTIVAKQMVAQRITGNG